MVKIKKKKVVVIGGGTGTYTVLMGLKKYPQLDLSVIVSMMDSGGSNRVIRDEFGLLPTSDIRQCVVALSEEKPDDLLRKLFTYRYSLGTGITGMTFGNLFMAALTDIYGSQKKAIEKTCEFLDVVGEIIPVTFTNSHLVARYSNGQQVLGEHLIDEPVQDDIGEYNIIELETVPEAKANTAALSALKNADAVILGPGDLYTSIICNLVVKGISSAIRKSKAKVIYVMNLMSKYGETHKFKASDYIYNLEKYIGKDRVSACVVNKGQKFPQGVLTRYRQERAYPVKDNLGRSSKKLKIIRRNVIAGKVYKKAKSDKLKRSLIRHDPTKLARAITSII
ncbi:uridine diphosphate-N-acetylglucosamine-binding protein YvcK [Patescibacteria group bacterium]